METPLVIVGADKKSPASVIQGLFHDHAGLVLVRESKAGLDLCRIHMNYHGVVMIQERGEHGIPSTNM